MDDLRTHTDKELSDSVFKFSLSKDFENPDYGELITEIKRREYTPKCRDFIVLSYYPNENTPYKDVKEKLQWDETNGEPVIITYKPFL